MRGAPRWSGGASQPPLLLVFSVLLVGGCVRMGYPVPGDLAEGPRDRGGDLLAVDRPARLDGPATADQAGAKDQRAVDQPPHDLSPADHTSVVDQLPHDLSPADHTSVVDQPPHDLSPDLTPHDLWHPDQACLNADLDGWTTCQGDCNDGDPSVFPGQASFFTLPSSGGSFDYNCDGKQEQQITALWTACTGFAPGCTGHGWKGGLPPCGVAWTWVTCKGTTPGSPCAASQSASIQACR